MKKLVIIRDTLSFYLHKGYLDIYEKNTDNKYLVKEYLIKKNREIITRSKHESHLFRSFFSVVNEKEEVLVTDLKIPLNNNTVIWLNIEEDNLGVEL